MKPSPRTLRLLLALVAVVILGISISRLDVGEVGGYLARLDASALLALVPFGIARIIDAAMFRSLLVMLGARSKFPTLFAIRLGTEAVSLSVIAGALVSEGVSPWLLARRSGIAGAITVAAQAGRKRAILMTHGILLGLGGLLGADPINNAAREMIGFAYVNWLMLAVSAVFITLAVLMGSLLQNGQMASRILALVRRIPRVGAWLDERAHHFAATDDRLRAVADLPPFHSFAMVAGYLAVWAMDVVETWVIMRLLGAPISLVEALALETVVSVLKVAAFAVPGGLGVQDLGYASILVAMKLPGGTALAAAFVVLKRIKELIWIGAGYAALAALGFAPKAVVEAAAHEKV